MTAKEASQQFYSDPLRAKILERWFIDYAKQEKIALLKKLIDQNAETNRVMLVEVVEELKILKQK